MATTFRKSRFENRHKGTEAFDVFNVRGRTGEEHTGTEQGIMELTGRES